MIFKKEKLPRWFIREFIELLSVDFRSDTHALVALVSGRVLKCHQASLDGDWVRLTEYLPPKKGKDGRLGREITSTTVQISQIESMEYVVITNAFKDAE